LQVSYNAGLAIADHRSHARIVMAPPRRAGKAAFMSRLADAIRSGAVRSAWDDYDSEEDAFAGRTSATRIQEQAKQDEERARYEAERRAAREAQEAKLAAAIERERLAREERAQVELESIDGFGSF
jgi:hypothetical protein